MKNQWKHNVWNGYEILQTAANSHAAEMANSVVLNKYGLFQEEFILDELPHLFCWITYRRDEVGIMTWNVEINLTFYGL